MEVQLTTEEQAQLVQIAQRTGRNAEEVVREAIHSFLQHETAFVEAVKRRISFVGRWRTHTHREMGARIEKLFQP